MIGATLQRSKGEPPRDILDNLYVPLNLREITPEGGWSKFGPDDRLMPRSLLRSYESHVRIFRKTQAPGGRCVRMRDTSDRASRAKECPK